MTQLFKIGDSSNFKQFIFMHYHIYMYDINICIYRYKNSNAYISKEFILTWYEVDTWYEVETYTKDTSRQKMFFYELITFVK